MSSRRLLLVLSLAALAGCDQLGIESATVTAARVEADGKAVGAACRHGGRAIEDCFVLNKKVDKAAIYAGWREMDDYMRENKLEVVPPTLPPGGPKKPAEGDAASGAEEAGGDKTAEAAPAAKPADKPAKAGEKAAARPSAKSEH